MSAVLLDTNAYTALLAGDTDVLKTISGADSVLMSVFVLGELLYGFKGGSRDKKNRTLLDSFLDKTTVETLSATRETAEYFSIIKDGLKRKGTPIPINDVWIAAHTMEHGAELVTYDKHFGKIENLRVWAGI